MARQVGFGGEAKDARPRAGARSRLIIGGFLALFLIGWSVGLRHAADEVLARGIADAPTGLVLWLFVGGAFWLAAAYALAKIILGRPIRTGSSGPGRPRGRFSGDDPGERD